MDTLQFMRMNIKQYSYLSYFGTQEKRSYNHKSIADRLGCKIDLHWQGISLDEIRKYYKEDENEKM